MTDLEKKIISAIQGDIPVTEKPYKAMAEKLGISEEEFLETLKSLDSRGIIRRFGATLRHQKSGFKANAMIAWKADEKVAVDAGTIMAEFIEVSHCYKRIQGNNWPYTLYTMVHGTDKENCFETAKRISEKTGIKDYSLLFSKTELKKTSMKYFTN
ncbi:MAG: Lrp/AsnC family transcriptional regulator [Desulfobacterales bacterium]|nr:Lrp/AsnC family transcriptional regulator [Desulfobacterales bacterium]MCP4164096.1 Lrp/AsnC family transcriptional regulator [Deltaproteobacteria bacterium]